MAKLGDLSGFNNFRSKINGLNKNKKSDLFSEILTRLCKLGSEYAHSLYNFSRNDGDESITVNSEVLADGYSARIVAEGNQIAYLEFGTGEMGRNSYKGNLPNISLSFYSSRLGQNVQLDGWTYSYANYLDKSQPMWKGFQAQAQMWKTAQYLRSIIPQVIREVAKT